MLRRLASRSIEAVRTNTALALLLVAVLGNCLLSAHWGLPDGATPESTSPWAVDTIAPLGPLSEANDRFARSDTNPVIYPLFHYVVLLAAYAPYVATAFATGALRDPGPEFPYGAVDPASFFAALNVIASLVSALMAAGIVFCIYQIARDLFDRRTALLAALLAALVPPLAYYGMTSNLDVPYLFWTLLAIRYLVSAALHGRLSSYIVCGIAAGLAFATKDQAAGYFASWPLLIPLIVASQRHAAHVSGGARGLLIDPRVLGAGSAALVALVLGNNLLFGGWDGFQRHLDFMDEFVATNLVERQNFDALAHQWQLLAKSLRLLAEMVGIPLLLLAVAGLVLILRQRHYAAWLLPWCALTYYVIVVAQTAALSRYLLGIALLATPLAAHAVIAAIDSSKALWQHGARAVAAAALLWQLALVVHLHGMLWNDSRRTMEQWVRAHVPAGATIESSTQVRYLPRLADSYRYAIVGNSFSAISYGLVGDELTPERLRARRPDYVLILADTGLSGDPHRLVEPALRAYYDALLGGELGYAVVASFGTPTWLPYRQLTVGTQPTTVLLERRVP